MNRAEDELHRHFERWEILAREDQALCVSLIHDPGQVVRHRVPPLALGGVVEEHAQGWRLVEVERAWIRENLQARTSLAAE